MRRLSAASLGLILAAASPVAAQEMTDEELLQLFLRQRDAFQEAQVSGIGQTRGLELITVDDLTTTPEVAAAAPSGEPPAVLDAVDPLSVPDAVAEAEGSGVPSEDDVTVTGVIAGSLDEPQGSDEVDQSVAVATEPSEREPTPVVFGHLAPELQVNVRVTFPFDSATLTEDQFPKLEQLCSVMKDSGINLFRIVGHTDATGGDAYNERLSLLRAQEVRRYFVTSCGLPAERLEAVGLGERFLYDTTDPAAAGNRRVEFQALS